VADLKKYKSMPGKALREARKWCRRQQQAGEKKDREVELVDDYDDPDYMPSVEHLALAEHSLIAAQMTVAYSSGFSDFESGNDVPAMPSPGPERERLLNPDLSLEEMPDAMRLVCVELNEARESAPGQKREPAGVSEACASGAANDHVLWPAGADI